VTLIIYCPVSPDPGIVLQLVNRSREHRGEILKKKKSFFISYMVFFLKLIQAPFKVKLYCIAG
jgi:hypothetical protein